MSFTFEIWKEVPEDGATIWETYDSNGRICYAATASDKLPTQPTAKTPMRALKLYREAQAA